MSSIGGCKLDNRTIAAIAVIAIVIIGAAAWMFTRPKPKENLIVSTTTSLYETGLLDVLKLQFEKSNPEYNVSFISQGTGLAIETAKRGDADMILVHSPGQELGFLESGFGVNRKSFAYNYFIIVGSESDPAGIAGMSPMDALNKISEEGVAGNALWVSRGDNSGTHSKEKGLWKAAEFDLEELKAETSGDSGDPWYIEAGAGMTATLQLANQKEAYTLTDVATFLKNKMNGNIESVKVVDSGKETINVYSARVCNPEKNTRGMYEPSMLFLRFLLSDEVQELLESYGEEEFGSTLFEPWVTTLESDPSSEIVGWVEDFAYIDGTECPIMYRHEAGDLYN
jgi:tungstate transport system substrate-binding protein